MNTRLPKSRRSHASRISRVARQLLFWTFTLSLAMYITAGAAFANNSEHNGHNVVALCHATGSGTNPYSTPPVDDSSVFSGGHTEESGDIIAAFTYWTFEDDDIQGGHGGTWSEHQYAGKNLGTSFGSGDYAVTGAQLLANDCDLPDACATGFHPVSGNPYACEADIVEPPPADDCDETTHHINDSGDCVENVDVITCQETGTPRITFNNVVLCVIDVCTNLPEDQTSVPVGYTSNGNGICIPVIVADDLCTNIGGIQSTMPADTEDPDRDRFCTAVQGQALGLTCGTGMHAFNGICVADELGVAGGPAAADLCSNIDGSQTSIPGSLEDPDDDGVCTEQTAVVAGEADTPKAVAATNAAPGRRNRGELPYTGLESQLLALFGMLFIGTGLGMHLIARRSQLS